MTRLEKILSPAAAALALCLGLELPRALARDWPGFPNTLIFDRWQGRTAADGVSIGANDAGGTVTVTCDPNVANGICVLNATGGTTGGWSFQHNGTTDLTVGGAAGQVNIGGGGATVNVSNVGQLNTSQASISTSTNATTVCTFSPAANSLVMVTGNVTVTAFTSGTVGMTVTYTDGDSSSTFTNNNTEGFSQTGDAINTSCAANNCSLTLFPTTYYVKGGTALTLKTAIGVATGTFRCAVIKLI